MKEEEQYSSLGFWFYYTYLSFSRSETNLYVQTAAGSVSLILATYILRSRFLDFAVIPII